MQIEVLKVDVSQATNRAGKSYNVAEIAYKNLDSGKVEGKKIVDFANKDIFQVVTNAKTGESFNVVTQKNEKSGYWDWVAMNKGGAAPSPVQGGRAAGNASPRSNYETPEERAARQVYIVRQSSVSSAVALLKTEKTQPKIEEVIDTAKVIEGYVFGADKNQKPEGDPAFEDMNDDVPY